MMTPADPAPRLSELIDTVTRRWVEDPASDVVWSGDHEGRRGVRMRQTVRDFTTVWFSVGQRTLGVEAYVLPNPPAAREEVFRQCLVRNLSTRRLRFALDADGDILLVARVPIAEVTADELDLLLGEVYELIEVAFRPLVLAAFSREKKS